VSPQLNVLMREPGDLIVNGFANFPRPPKFRRHPKPEVMRPQVSVIREILLGEEVVNVFYRTDGKQHSDGTFVYDHAFFIWILGRHYAFLPCLKWPRHHEMPMDLPIIKEHANAIQPPSKYKGKNLRFDPGTIAQGPGIILVGYSKFKRSRTNKTGANFIKAKLLALGYTGEIVLVQHIGLHLSTFCTSIATSEKPEPVFLVNSKYVKDVAAIRRVAKVILVDDDEAWRANAISHWRMRSIMLMHRWLPGRDKLLRKLRRRGYKVIVVKLTESPCVQGSLFCHVLMWEAAA
jgi:N-dimethylarginine dimethylaminohydrolase